jgi:hypothetical protein
MRPAVQRTMTVVALFQKKDGHPWSNMLLKGKETMLTVRRGGGCEGSFVVSLIVA